MAPHSRMFDSLKNEADLASRLTDLSARKRLERVSVALRINDRRMFAAAERGTSLPSRSVEDHLVPAMCLAKPLTATLLAEATSRDQLDWRTEINDLLTAPPRLKAKLAGVTLTHLLNHTHGLDASAVVRVPRNEHGFVDVEALSAQLPSRPLSAPGYLYSYSNAGPWFVGAFLERRIGRRYSELLNDGHLWSSSRSKQTIDLDRVCAATGDELKLTVSQWLAFLELHVRDPLSGDVPLATAIASLRATSVPLPGWSPSEQGACMGWKCYGSGWFGHNSYLPGSSALLRFCPGQDIAIVVEAPGEAAFKVLAGLFGTGLPEFANLRPPRLLNAQESVVLELDRYVGTYTQAHSCLRIEKCCAGTLGFSSRARNSDTHSLQCSLRPAEGELFIPELRDNPDFAFLQFVQADATGAFGYLWNGRQLWRRE